MPHFQTQLIKWRRIRSKNKKDKEKRRNLLFENKCEIISLLSSQFASSNGVHWLHTFRVPVPLDEAPNQKIHSLK